MNTRYLLLTAVFLSEALLGQCLTIENRYSNKLHSHALTSCSSKYLKPNLVLFSSSGDEPSGRDFLKSSPKVTRSLEQKESNSESSNAEPLFEIAIGPEAVVLVPAALIAILGVLFTFIIAGESQSFENIEWTDVKEIL